MRIPKALFLEEGFYEMSSGSNTGGSGEAPKVTVLGGGHGISTVLGGLASRVRQGLTLQITAVVATADDGGSSGRLRAERGGLPPGDLRRCLLALAEPEHRLARLFAHRYDGGGDLAGHVLGNLVLAALADQEGCYQRAVNLAGEMLGACGRVMPATLQSVRLEGVTRDGLQISGESQITRAPCALKSVWLDPPDARPAPGVEEAIQDADVVVVGPGSLFTSLLAVLLVPGIVEAMRRCRGRRVLLANLMTQPGETMGMNLEDHLEALDRHTGSGLFQTVLVHGRPIPAKRLEPYREKGCDPVAVHGGAETPEPVVLADLAKRSGKIRHHAARTAGAVLAVLDDSRACGRPELETSQTQWIGQAAAVERV